MPVPLLSWGAAPPSDLSHPVYQSSGTSPSHKQGQSLLDNLLLREADVPSTWRSAESSYWSTSIEFGKRAPVTPVTGIFLTKKQKFWRDFRLKVSFCGWKYTSPNAGLLGCCSVSGALLKGHLPNQYVFFGWVHSCEMYWCTALIQKGHVIFKVKLPLECWVSSITGTEVVFIITAVNWVVNQIKVRREQKWITLSRIPIKTVDQFVWFCFNWPVFPVLFVETLEKSSWE